MIFSHSNCFFPNNLLIIIRKDCEFLGEVWQGGVPIEVIPMAQVPVIRHIKQNLGGCPTLRMAKSKAVSISHFFSHTADACAIYLL